MFKDGQPKAILLSDYQAPEFHTEKTDLIFDIREGVTEVTATMQVRRQGGAGQTMVLDGQQLELLEVMLDGRQLASNEYQVDDDKLTLFGLQDAHEIVIKNRVCPEENTALEGLYRSGSMYCTQCEAEGFRKITYYQDRPDILSRFTTTIIADPDAYPNLLSNGNLIASEDLADGRKQVTWEDPFPKPSYLFALVAGNLALLEDEFVTASGRRVVLQIFSEPHNIDQCDYAMDVLKRSMRWDEQRFGREYDLDIYMIVAVEDFNMGAMENKGLNVFNTSCVLATPDTATDQAYARVEAVVAHEYFHNWSGNRVTCRDWFQLSLKEGFTVFRDAEFSSDMNSRAVKRIEDVGILRSIQFAEDGGPLAHPVRPSSYIEISNFYTTTIYEKGAEVVRMYHTLLGEQAFRQGTDLYFDRFDGTAATTDDFMQAMSEAGNIDLSQFKRWYEQAGTPELAVTETFADGQLTLSIAQSCPATPGQPVKQPFHMPILLGLVGADGEPLLLEAAQLVTSAKAELRDSGQSVLFHLTATADDLIISGLSERPVISFLREFSAPVRVHYPRPSRDLALLAAHDRDGFVRWDALQTLWVGFFDSRNSDITEPPIEVIAALAKQALGLQSADAKLLVATMLSVPAESYLFEELRDFDVDVLLDARDVAAVAVATRLQDTWRELYARYHSDVAYSPNAEGMAHRALSNIALGHLVLASDAQTAQSLLEAHYQHADNLTDRRAALNLTCRLPGLAPAFRAAMLQDFYERWQSKALVIDLWFNLQAQSPLTTLEDLDELTRHPSFDAKNPNRLRSVYGVFGMLNARRFHAIDGSGYQYLSKAILQLDKTNPQIAARLTAPLTRGKRFAGRRQSLMQGVLRDMAARDDLSKDLYEIVNKSLTAD